MIRHITNRAHRIINAKSEYRERDVTIPRDTRRVIALEELYAPRITELLDRGVFRASAI
jgi:hypothetical protein